MSRQPRSSNPGLDFHSKFLLALVLIPGVIDYRFVNPTAITVAIYAGLSVLSALGAVALTFQHGLAKNKLVNFMAVLGFLLLAVSITVGLFRGQEAKDVLRAAPPIFLYSCSIVAISALWRSGKNISVIWETVIKSAALAALFQFLFVLIGRGINFETIRYEILSGAAPLLTAYLVTVIIFGRASPISLPVFGLHVATILLSVTRTQLFIAIAAVAASLISGALRYVRPGRIGVAVASIAIGGVLVGLVGSALPGAPLERWADRMFEVQQRHHGIDVTTVTRTGEATYQLQHLGASTSALLFGLGVAAPTTYSDDAARIITFILGQKAGYWTDRGVGHNNYVGTIFVGGVLVGGSLIIAQLVIAVQAMMSMSKISSLPTSLSNRTNLISIPLSYLAYLAFGTLGGTLAIRSASVYLGLTLALTLWAIEVARKKR